MKIGYARVSTVAQDLETQRKKLLAAGVDEKHIYTDKGFSGKTMTRAGLDGALKALRSGDVLVIPSVDRLARNVREALRLVDELKQSEIRLDIGGLVYDPDNEQSKMLFTILAAVAEAEGGWISTRTKEAMAREDVRRKLTGKRTRLEPVVDEKITWLHKEGGMSITALADKYELSRPTIYRALARHRDRVAAAAAEAPVVEQQT